MSEPPVTARREPSGDFEHWIASSLVPPSERDPDSLCEGIAAAIRSRDFEGVNALLIVLAPKDPRKAQVIYDVIMAACDGDERRAVLLAALG
jgi:hypothetical protein